MKPSGDVRGFWRVPVLQKILYISIYRDYLSFRNALRTVIFLFRPCKLTPHFSIHLQPTVMIGIGWCSSTACNGAIQNQGEEHRACSTQSLFSFFHFWDNYEEYARLGLRLHRVHMCLSGYRVIAQCIHSYPKAAQIYRMLANHSKWQITLAIGFIIIIILTPVQPSSPLFLVLF